MPFVLQYSLLKMHFVLQYTLLVMHSVLQYSLLAMHALLHLVSISYLRKTKHGALSLVSKMGLKFGQLSFFKPSVQQDAGDIN